MLTVRQVPLMPAVFEIQQKFTCKNRCTFILSVHLLSLVFSTKQPFLLSLRLIGCIANIAPVSGDSMLTHQVLKYLFLCVQRLEPTSTATNFSFCFSLYFEQLSGQNVPSFDTAPKGFIALTPSFWSVPNWKAGIFMHHNVQLLEQVFLHQVRTNNQTFSARITFVHFLTVEGFCAT